MRNYLRVLLWLSFIPVPAWASYLSVQSTVTVEIEQREESVGVRVTTTLKNHGDEMAYDVFPELFRGAWSRVGEGRNLAAGEEFTWKTEDEVPLEKFFCDAGSTCERSKSTLGVWPIFFRKHYRDANRYAFTAPEVIAVTVGALSDENRATLVSNELKARSSLDGNGQSFQLVAEILPVDSREVVSRIFSSSEFEYDSEPKRIELKAQRRERIRREIQNFTAIPGSSYPVFLVLEWDLNGLHQTQVMSSMAKVEESRLGSAAIIAAIGVMFVLVVAYWQITRRPSKK